MGKLDWCGKCKVGNPRINALIGMPILFGIQTFVIIFMILIKSPQVKKSVEMTQKIWISIVCAIGLMIVSGAIMVPLVRRRLPSVVANKNAASEAEEGKAAGTGAPENVDTSLGEPDASKKDDGAHKSILALGSTIESKKEIDYPTAADSSTAAMQPSEWDLMSWEERDATFTFRFVLVFVAALEAFAHGSNDTGNATGAFSAVYQTWSEGLNTCGKAQTPVWIMAAAGAFVFLGVNLLGYRAIGQPHVDQLPPRLLHRVCEHVHRRHRDVPWHARLDDALPGWRGRVHWCRRVRVQARQVVALRDHRAHVGAHASLRGLDWRCTHRRHPRRNPPLSEETIGFSDKPPKQLFGLRMGLLDVDVEGNARPLLPQGWACG